MKNAINYFYNLTPTNIYQNKEEYFFTVENNNYIFQECNRTDEEIYELYNLEFYLYKYNIYFHQIILNKDNNLVTPVNNKRYVLLKVFNNDNNRIDLNEITKISNIKVIGEYQHIRRNNWRDLWSRKIDYIEQIIDENKFKYKEFVMNIDYFIGLTENAIQLLEEVNYDSIYISHQRINSNMKIRDLYNPLNIILDYKVRDACEYFKDSLFKKRDIKIIEYLSSYQLTIEEIYLFFIRFLYLTRYFDLFDNAFINNEMDKVENEILIITNEIERYEINLKQIYEYIYQKGIIIEIEWLKKTS